MDPETYKWVIIGMLILMAIFITAIGRFLWKEFKGMKEDEVFIMDETKKAAESRYTPINPVRLEEADDTPLKRWMRDKKGEV